MLERMKRIRPSILRGTPSFLVPLAHENMLSGMDVRIRKSFTFSEVLGQRARDLIASSFGCEVYDAYGAVETSWIAWQCGEGALHINSDFVVAEIVDDHGAPVRHGDYGNIVITPLWQRAMPLIRYVVGDRAAFGPPCGCGRGLPTLKSVEGRDNDLVVLPSGRVCSAHLIGFNMRSMPGVLRFQTVQGQDGSLAVSIVPDKSGQKPDCRQISATLSSVFPEPIGISVETVERLPVSRAGKLREFVSRARLPEELR
jgi:phenylacetate-CoA ligase